MEARHHLVNVLLAALFFLDGLHGDFRSSYALSGVCRTFSAWHQRHDSPDVLVQSHSSGFKLEFHNEAGRVRLQPALHDAQTLRNGQLSWYI